jgi:NADPH-dependent 2,4-dienoyl-CoA reductase/sulfur reductase-like enzyme
VIVGAGPAGLAAAHALAVRGVRDVLVVERDDAPGGLPRYCHHPGFGREYTHRLESGPRFARRLIACLEGAAVRIAARSSVIAIAAGPELEIVSAELGHERLRPVATILATGIRERPRSARLIPGKRPERGILTTGQLQQMVARGVDVGGRRAVVVGTEHVAFSVLLTARRAGMRVVAMIGAEERVMSLPAAGAIARLLGTSIHLASAIEDIEGGARVEAIVIRGPSGSTRIACDTILLAGDFVPDSPLARAGGIAIDPRTQGPEIDQFGRTSMPGVFAAGNLLRAVESSGFAAIEGARVGANVAAHLDGALPWPRRGPAIAAGAGLAYVVPQRWALDDGSGATGQALPTSLRAAVDMRGAALRLSQDGTTIWSGQTRSIRRLRRIALPSRAFVGLQSTQAAEIALDVV